jgi:cytochrome oxidase Cu insertion factor (SCO1/SenC/PrrC family)
MNMESDHPSRGRLKVLSIAGLFLLPVLIAYVLFGTGWRPSTTGNYGELVQPPRPITDVALQSIDGARIGFNDLRGKWNLIYFTAAECLKPCTDALYKMRQVSLAQGKEAGRIRRIVVVYGTKVSGRLRNTLSDYPNMQVITGPSEAVKTLARQFYLPVGTPLDGLHRIYLVDPLGNFMMSYAANADPTGMRKDLARLLKVSQVG